MSSSRTLSRRIAPSARSLFVFLAVAAGCASDPPPRSNVLHAMPVSRATVILLRVFDEARLDVDRGRPETIGGKPLTVDLSAAGRRFGVAYLTREMQRALGAAIPKHDPDATDLFVVNADSGDRILLLYERDYMTDDLEGESHNATTIVAETRLQRDARDFLLRAQRDQWP